MRKLAIAAIAAGLLIGTATAVLGASGGSDLASRNTSAEDVRGPCDEAEHANDPRCNGVGGNRADDDRDEVGDTDDAVEGGDIPGPCDEAEHANDPRCTGVAAPAAGARPDDDEVLETGEDMPGPCDEAEHANDPRCTGVGRAIDNSGPGSASSGPGPGPNQAQPDNSGPGSQSSGSADSSGPSDSSGPGSGGDDDSSGGDDDDSSGRGHSGSG